tara:strand:+ start:1000 stop:1701 length:702 start_codon:yes stop_codon:yes gene_type:complete
MPLFYLKYTINESARGDCITLFGGMTKEMDLKDMGENVKLLGRWSTVAESAGYCICEAKDAKSLNNWLLNWAIMAKIEAYPIVDDNTAREIILKEKPSYEVDYSKVGFEAREGESLYFIEYKFRDDMREQGYNAFAKLSKEEDIQDAGNNVCYGRWHNLGTGSGVAICSSKGEVDLYTWAFNWTGMCDCIIKPVVSDRDCRLNIVGKPDFDSKHAALMEKMKNPSGKKSSWFR